MAELEAQLVDVGARLQVAPDDAGGLLTLLDEVEEYLLRVEQSPSESTSGAIRPAMAALARGDLLGHPNADVRLSVASCISEVTRITAPEAPYDDAVMKDVFSIIVEAFESLDDIESPSFQRRASILETVAKVRSCVVMLDLELDDLIREMFHHFFATVSSDHPENVIASMITTMRLVIEESEDIHTSLALCILRNAKNEKKETSPASFELAEKVISVCGDKLKPAFLQILEDTPLDDYNKVVTSVCGSVKVVKEGNNVDPSGRDMVDDGKLSERTISDELPQVCCSASNKFIETVDSTLAHLQEPSKLEQDVSRPEQDGALTTAISSGGTPVDNGETSQGSSLPKEKPEQPHCTENTKDVDNLESGNNESAEPVAAKPKKSSDDSGKDLKLKPCKSEATGNSNVDVDKEALVSADNKVVNGVADEASKPADTTPDVVKPKRGRPPGPKSLEKKAARRNQPSGLDLKKTGEATESAGKLTKRSAKDDIKSSTMKAGDGELSKKQQKISLKQQKDGTLSEEDTAKDLTLKDMVSPKSLRTKGQSRQNSGVKRKHEQETEETPRSRKNKGLDASLVGAKIKVWWPDDEMFYQGVVASFDTDSKRHKIAYDDGDVEVLLLSDEKWDFIGGEQAKTPDVASEIRSGRKGRGNPGHPLKEAKSETPKSDGGNLPKKRGRPKGWHPNSGTPSTTPRGKTASKDAKGTPKSGTDPKKDGEKGSKDKATQSTEKTKDDLPKDSSNQSASKSKEGKGKDSKDEGKSSEVRVKPGRKPKATATPEADNASVKEKRKEMEGAAAETNQEGSGKASTGKKRRRKA